MDLYEGDRVRIRGAQYPAVYKILRRNGCWFILVPEDGWFYCQRPVRVHVDNVLPV